MWEDFSIQLDESADITDSTLGLYEISMERGFLSVFAILLDHTWNDNRVRDIQSVEHLWSWKYKLNWVNWKRVTIDGRASQKNKNSGDVSKMSEAAGNHCFIHQEAMAAKSMQLFIPHI